MTGAYAIAEPLEHLARDGDRIGLAGGRHERRGVEHKAQAGRIDVLHQLSKRLRVVDGMIDAGLDAHDGTVALRGAAQPLDDRSRLLVRLGREIVLRVGERRGRTDWQLPYCPFGTLASFSSANVLWNIDMYSLASLDS